VEEAGRIVSSHIGNHGRIGPKEDTKYVSDRKNREDEIH
jgi:hypothetical protein